MGKSLGGGGGGRDWLQIYAIYGSGDWHTVLFLLFQSLILASASIALFLYFNRTLRFLHLFFPSISLHALRYTVGFAGSSAGLAAVCLLCAAGNVLYSSLPLRRRIAARMVASVPDWSSVRTALDVGCGRGILLNAVAVQLKKSGSSGRVVGLGRRRETAVDALRRARAEGVQEYVTCREGDARRLPFADGYFDVVVSAVHLSGLGKGAEERGKGIGEMVRVLRPGGIGVVWDLACVPELVERLWEMRMVDIRVSEKITAYMAASQIVSFRKPLAGAELLPPVDWRTNI